MQQFYRLKDQRLLQQHLSSSYKLYLLVEDLKGDNHWQATDQQQEELAQRPPISSPKKLLFKEQENLFVFDGQQFRETLPEPEPFVLYGVHSCDLTAIAYQDRFFAEDPYYQARRRQALLVGIDCISPCEYGFCPAVDAGPGVNPAHADLILHCHDAGQWILVVCSPKGEAAVSELPLLKAQDTAEQSRLERLEHCRQMFGETQHITRGIAALNQRELPDSFWQSLGVQCLGCSGCTTLCPTCSCYGTRDTVVRDTTEPGTATSDTSTKDTVKQQRFWDSCLYESFQREASQHNPSLGAGQRVRRFWQHKFGDAFAEEYGRYGCVGCGRCEETCPGVIGVHTVMHKISAREA